MTELRDRLRARFSGVPGVTDTDLDAWLTEASYIYGYSPATVDQVPDNETPLVLLLAQIQGARAIAFQTAHYFKYTDAEESVDKTAVAKQWRDLANDLAEQYEREKSIIDGGGGRVESSAFRIAKRADRP
jgi:hypothetical protein